MTDVSQLNKFSHIDGRVTYTGWDKTEVIKAGDRTTGKSNEKEVYQQILGTNYDKVFNKAGNLILFDHQKIMDYANSEAVSSEDFQHFTEDISTGLYNMAYDDENNLWLEDMVNYVPPEVYSELEVLDTNQDGKITELEVLGVSEADISKVTEYLESFINVLAEGNYYKETLTNADIEQLNQIYLTAENQVSESAFEIFQQELVYLYLQIDLFDFSEDAENPIIKYEQ